MNRCEVASFLQEPTILTPLQRSTHTYVIGQTGTGKSRALESWVMQDISAGNGVGVIDPHGDLFQRLLLRLTGMPDQWERVVVIDVCNPKWAVGINPLALQDGIPAERTALFLTDVIIKIWRLDATQSPRLVWLLTNTFHALSDLGLSLLELPRFLLHPAYRESLLPHLSSPQARDYFGYEYPKTLRGAHSWVTPLLNKLGGLIFDPDIRPMLTGEPTINFADMMDKRLILLVNVPKGLVGEETSALIAAFIVARLQKAALARARDTCRVPFYLYLDEFQNYTTDNIKDILSESRKYRLSLTLAHQYLEQLTPDIRSAVLNNAGTLISFRVGYRDAAVLAKDIFPSPDFLSVAGRSFIHNPLLGWPMLATRTKLYQASWDALSLELTQLHMREFWCRRRWDPRPSKHRTWDVPDPATTPQRMSAVRSLLDVSGSRYARLKDHDSRSISRGRHSGESTNAGRSSPQETPAFCDHIPLWGD